MHAKFSSYQFRFSFKLHSFVLIESRYRCHGLLRGGDVVQCLVSILKVETHSALHSSDVNRLRLILLLAGCHRLAHALLKAVRY